MTRRNWYQALHDDLKIDLIALRKEHDVSVTEKSLSTYRDKGTVPTKKPAKDAIYELVKYQRPSFTPEMLEEYWRGDYAEDQKARTRQIWIDHVRKALNFVADTGFDFDFPSLGQPKEAAPLADWIYQTITLSDGLESVGQFLELVYLQIESQKQLLGAKDLLEAIAPLVIIDDQCVEPAREKLLRIQGVDSYSGPAAAALAIARGRGQTQRLVVANEMTTLKHFTAPENAVVESSFSAEQDDIKQRLAHRLFQGLKLIPAEKIPGEVKFTEDDYKKLDAHGQRSSKRLRPPFIYLRNGGSEYPLEQLDEYSDFPGFHRFADEAQHDVVICGDEFAIEWLLQKSAELETIEKGLKDLARIKSTLEKLPSAMCTAEIIDLQQDLENLNSTDLLKRATEITTILVNSGHIAGKAPEIAEAGVSMFEYCSTLYTFLEESTKQLLGGS